jgi:putative transposase
MPRIYELPTQLQMVDVLIAGLTARQRVRQMVGASLAYGVWDQAGWLPQEVRLALPTILNYDGAKRVNGLKRHILVDSLGLVLRAKVHTADIQDRAGVPFG